MRHVEFNGKEIMIANLDGKFYALNDRCSHTNAPPFNGKYPRGYHNMSHA
jgi:nitrite reductase/ring-hydroxylating ferredoxin subunit